jgi:hypothetical protein
MMGGPCSGDYDRLGYNLDNDGGHVGGTMMEKLSWAMIRGQDGCYGGQLR